jgi:hypothetical protein
VVIGAGPDERGSEGELEGSPVLEEGRHDGVRGFHAVAGELAG